MLHRVTGRLPLSVPHIVLIGEPDEAFPYRWTVQQWLADEPVRLSGDPAIDEGRAEALASAVDALHRIGAEGLPTRRSIDARSRPTGTRIRGSLP